MSALKPYGDIKYKARTYTDKDGKEKGVWIKVGTLFATPHLNNITIKMDSMPVGEWNGWLSIYKNEDFKVETKEDEETDIPAGDIPL